ncbi:MAG: caspase family protein [Xanthobacteraceae bacterium]
MSKYALIVGVNEYQVGSGVTGLDYAVADALGLAATLREICGFKEITFLAGPSPGSAGNGTRENIINQLARFAGILQEGDLFLLALFMHGSWERVDDEWRQYFIPYDAHADYPSSYLEQKTLQHELEKLKAKQRVIVLDTCRIRRSGTRDLGSSEPDDAARNLLLGVKKETGTSTFVVSACGQGQQAYEVPDFGHGAFTHYLIEAIRNVDAKPGKGISGWRHGALECRYLAKEVGRAVKDKTNGTQTPSFAETGEPIVLATGPSLYRDRDKGRVDTAKPKVSWTAFFRLPRAEQITPPALMALVVAAALFLARFDGAARQDPYCPSSGPKGINVVLIDVRGDIAASEKQQINVLLENRAFRVHKDNLLQLRHLDGRKSEEPPLFSECRPNDVASDFSSGEKSPRLIWLAKYRTKIQEALETIRKVDKSAASPIMETIKEIAESRLASFENGAQVPGGQTDLTLTIVSDLVQDTAIYSQREGITPFQEFRSISAYFPLHTNLNNTDVRVYYLRDTANADLDPHAHLQFWSDWFQDANARSFLRVIP